MSDSYMPKKGIDAYPLCKCGHNDHDHAATLKGFFSYLFCRYSLGSCNDCTCPAYTFSGKANVRRTLGGKTISYEIEDWKE